MKVIHTSDGIRMDRRKSLVKSYSFDLFFWFYMKLIKVAFHTKDVLWREILVQIQNHASLNTSCIVSLFNPIELWSIAMHCGGQ